MVEDREGSLIMRENGKAVFLYFKCWERVMESFLDSWWEAVFRIKSVGVKDNYLFGI